MYPLCMFTVQKRENWKQERSNVFLWDIPQLKRGISVIIHHPKRFLSQQMLISMRVSPIFLLLIFKGRIPSRKTRIKIPISLISLSLTLIQSLVQCPIQYSYRTSLNPRRRRRLSLLLRNKWLKKCTQRIKLQP